MTEYKYKVTGLYKDWCIMKKNREIIHDGSAFMLGTNNSDLFFRINYQKYNNQEAIMRKSNNLYITVPKMPNCQETEYTYVCCIFSENQYLELVNIVYLDYKYTENVIELSKNELLRAWVFSNNTLINYDRLELLIPNIIAFSDTEISIEILSDILEMKSFEIIERPKGSEIVTAFIDIDDIIYEWDCLIHCDNEIYLNIDTDYSVKFVV